MVTCFHTIHIVILGYKRSDSNMKISTKGRYAVRMMIDIAQHDNGEWISIRDIAKRQDISIKYLEQIVTNLTRAGLLVSSRGPKGGYRLAKKADNYTIGEILRVIEGDFAPVSCLEPNALSCDRRNKCDTIEFWEGLYHVINEYMDSVTLEELADSQMEKEAYNYTI